MANDPTPSVEQKITHAAIDPIWLIGTLNLGEFVVPFVSLDHPEHGPLNMIIPVPSAKQIVKMLNHVIDTAEGGLPRVH